MKIGIELESAFAAWPVGYDPETKEARGGSRAVLMNADKSMQLAPVIAWGMVTTYTQEGSARNIVPLLWNQEALALSPASMFIGFVGILHPGDEPEALAEEAEEVFTRDYPQK